MFLDIEAGGFSLDIGIEGEDEFFDSFGFDASEELFDFEIRGHSAGNRGDDTSEYVVAAMVHAESLERYEIEIIFDYAEYCSIASGIATDFTFVMSSIGE